MNDYQTLSAYYDRLMPQADNEARADYLLALFARFGESPRSVLDLACGTGEMTKTLAKRGLDMTGVDGSEEMLAEAADKVMGFTPEVLLLKQDMRALDLRDTVDGAICLQDSLNHLLKTADLQAVFDRLRLFVAPGGLVLFDLNTPFKHREILGNHDFVLETEGLVCNWQNLYTEKTATVDMQLDFFEEQPDGCYVRTTDFVRERAYSLKTIRHILEKAEFSLCAVFADGTFESPAADCERWMLVAKNCRPAKEFTE